MTEKEVRYVADLANLNLNPEEIQRMVADLGEILGHMDRLREIDTDNVAPMAQVLYDAGDGADATATLRADVPREPLGNVAALANAPLAGSGYFKVPLVIERS